MLRFFTVGDALIALRASLCLCLAEGSESDSDPSNDFRQQKIP